MRQSSLRHEMIVAGLRIGKGEGFADLEYAMMRSMKAVDDKTPIVTAVHDCQVRYSWHHSFFFSCVFYSSWGRKNTRYKIGSIFQLDACCFRYLTSCLNGCLASMTCRSTTSSPPLRSSSASPTDPSPRASCGRCWRERRFDKFPSSRWPALPVIHRKALNCKEPYPRHCFKVQAVSVVAWPVRRRYMNWRPLQYWG